MEYLLYFIDLFVHLDKHLGTIIETYGTWVYAILFIIVFCETGLVVTPFLPGDSLLFAAGTFAGMGKMHVSALFFLLFTAAFLGDNVNYWIGRYIGPKVFHYESSRFFKREYLEKTHRFFEKYGGKTLIIAQFMPIIRTFAPFTAGVGSMTYPKFLFFNVIGVLSWVIIFVFGGYYFGSLPFVKKNFTLVIMAIIFISILPGIIEYIRHRNDDLGSAEPETKTKD